MPTGGASKKGRKQNYTRRKLEFEMLWYVWTERSRAEVMPLLGQRHSCQDFVGVRPPQETRSGVKDVHPSVDWAWKYPKFRAFWHSMEVQLRLAVEGTTECIDGNLGPLLLNLAGVLVHLTYTYKYKVGRCTSTFMHRVKHWHAHGGERQSLLKLIAGNCKMLMNDGMIEYVHSLIARSLPARKVPTSYVQQTAHLIKPRREALNAAWRGKNKKADDTGEIDRLRKEVRTNRKYSNMRERIHNWLMAIARECITPAHDNTADPNGSLKSVEKAVMTNTLRKPNTRSNARARRWGIDVSHVMSEKLFEKHKHAGQ